MMFSEFEYTEEEESWDEYRTEFMITAAVLYVRHKTWPGFKDFFEPSSNMGK